MLEICDAKYSGDYKIYLVFNNGRAGVANLEKTILNDTRAIFSKFRDKKRFAEFKVDHGTIVWSDEFDLASEYLFYLAFNDDPELQAKFKEWGYVEIA
jgi:hypothetical protein